MHLKWHSMFQYNPQIISHLKNVWKSLKKFSKLWFPPLSFHGIAVVCVNMKNQLHVVPLILRILLTCTYILAFFLILCLIKDLSSAFFWKIWFGSQNVINYSDFSRSNRRLPLKESFDLLVHYRLGSKTRPARSILPQRQICIKGCATAGTLVWDLPITLL